MNTKIRYDLDSLELANGDLCPTEGDSVEFVTRSGDYFGKAHIERITGKYADICLIPETVFCFDDMGKAAYDTTGSPWTQVNIRNMKPAGTEIRIFRTWGFGKRSNTGSLRFDAPVRKWEYREPNPLYDGYTTRNWFRYHIMKHRDGQGKDRRIHLPQRFIHAVQPERAGRAGRNPERQTLQGNPA